MYGQPNVKMASLHHSWNVVVREDNLRMPGHRSLHLSRRAAGLSYQ